MVQEFKLPEGYYTFGPHLLIRLHHVVWQAQLGYVVETVAISQKIPKEKRDYFYNVYKLYQKDKVHIFDVFIPNQQFIEKPEDLAQFKLLNSSEVDTIRLLYTSDQSAEGTTVEANKADSTVSDAKSGERQP